MKHNEIQKVCVVGLGYIGLPTAALIASRGVHVAGFDVNAEAIETINRGEIHIVEPELDMLVHASVATGHLRASNEPESADVFVIAVPTPFTDNYQADLSYVEGASRRIAPYLKTGDLVILESTSPVGTTENIEKWLIQERPDLFRSGGDRTAAIDIAYCPERVLPGRIIHELVQNDRVIGGITTRAAERAKQFYQLFVEGECIVTTARTAEMCKLTENAFRDVNIAFANELSMIADEINIDVWELIRLANRHPRVDILQPGPGVGGHCIAVDPWFIINSAPTHAQLMRAARAVNSEKPRWVIAKIEQQVAYMSERGRDRPKVCCMGLTFKADIDDLRESPALAIVEEMVKTTKSEFLVIEPNIEQLPSALASISHVKLSTDPSDFKDSDICVILVDHKEFQTLSFEDYSGLLIDTKGILQK